MRVWSVQLSITLFTNSLKIEIYTVHFTGNYLVINFCNIFVLPDNVANLLGSKKLVLRLKMKEKYL